MDTPEQMRTITLRVNGTTHTATVPVRKTLLDFVREDLMLTDSHAGHAGSIRFAVDSGGVARYSAPANATLSDVATCHDCPRHACCSSH